jgi:glycosyltransferase involved in cell wall biosynthesis
MAQLRRTVAELNIAQAVHFAGDCNAQCVAKWMNASDLVVLPSYMEGCPNVLLEAQSCGCPVIATAVGGIPEIVSEENGILIAPRDVDALTQAHLELFRRAWDRSAIALRSQRSWEEVAAEVHEGLCRAVEERRGIARPTRDAGAGL